MLRQHSILVLAVSAVLLSLLVAGCDDDKRLNQSSAAACCNNLRLISGAKAQWALNGGQAPYDVPTWDDLLPYLSKGKPACPDGGEYTLGKVGELPKCSIGGPRHSIPGRQP